MMKKLKLIAVLLLGYAGVAFGQDNTGMPPEDTTPGTYWPWLIGMLVALIAGMILYRIIKKNPRKDVPR